MKERHASRRPHRCARGIRRAAIGLLAIPASLWLACAPAPEDPRPLGGAEDVLALAERDDVNLLFILVDTLRSHRLHTYGYSRETSPFFDALALQGVRFARHQGQSSWTKCSMASLWTALNPQNAGVTKHDDRLPDEAVLASEVLRDAGFRTAGVWRNGWIAPNFGFGQGFEIYTRPAPRRIPANIRRENPTESFRGTDLDVVDSAREFIRVHAKERWFLYLHLMDVHEYTYSEESAVFGATYSDVYDNAILHTNHVLNRLTGDLYEAGLLPNTVIAIASDHGEAFGERRTEGHARDVYPETIEVPFLIGLPFRLSRPAVVGQRTANVDIWPTLLEMLGLPPLEGVDGRSRMPEILAAIRGETAPPDEGYAISHLDRSWGQRVKTAAPNVTLTEHPFRYVQFRNAKDEIIREELFDARRDPDERENRLDEEPDVAARLRDTTERYLSASPRWADVPAVELDEMELNQLRALGYAIP